MKLAFFPAIFVRPTHIRLTHQEEDEHIDLFLRPHWVTNLPWIIMTGLGALLPLFAPLISQQLASLVALKMPQDILIAFLIVWYLFLIAYSLEQFLHWYFNIYIVTNEHLVDINFSSLMYRDTTEVCLEDVQSTQAKIKGVMGALFNFGDVTIETAAKGQTVDFLRVPKPDFVSDRIMDLQQLHEGVKSDVS